MKRALILWLLLTGSGRAQAAEEVRVTAKAD